MREKKLVIKMRKRKRYSCFSEFLLLFVCLFMLSFLPAKAVAVTLGISSAVASPGDSVQLEIQTGNSTDIAGMVFTISYDTGALELQSVTDNGFFSHFVVGEQIEGIGRMISAARAQTGGDDSCNIILNFRVKTDSELSDGIVTGDYEIQIVPSVINYPLAGYNTDTTIHALWGLDKTQDPLVNPELAYPKLAVDFVTGTIAIDRDGDGLTDVQETNIGTDIDNRDSDGDGMQDGWEVEHNFDPLNQSDGFDDADGDGFCNLREYISGTNPNDGNSKPASLLADSDGDGDVDGDDLSRLAQQFGQPDCDSSSCSEDLDGNGRVDHVDLRLFVEELGRN